MALLNAARSPIPLHIREVDIAAGALNRRVVEVDVLGSRRAFKLPLTYGNQDLRQVRRLQTVRRFGRLLRLATTALGAADIQVLCCAHAFLQA
ncbi:hypothetical protein D3C80_1785390 [compost metagenome]